MDTLTQQLAEHTSWNPFAGGTWVWNWLKKGLVLLCALSIGFLCIIWCISSLVSLNWSLIDSMLHCTVICMVYWHVPAMDHVVACVRDQSCVWGPAMFVLLLGTSTRQWRKGNEEILIVQLVGIWPLREKMCWELNLKEEQYTMELLLIWRWYHELWWPHLTLWPSVRWCRNWKISTSRGGDMRCGSGVEGLKRTRCMHFDPGDFLKVQCLPAPPTWAPCSISFCCSAAFQKIQGLVCIIWYCV